MKMVNDQLNFEEGSDDQSAEKKSKKSKESKLSEDAGNRTKYKRLQANFIKHLHRNYKLNEYFQALQSRLLEFLDSEKKPAA